MFNNIDSIFKKYMSEDFFTGGVCSISVNGKNVFHRAYGVSNINDKNPCEQETVFDLASLTKLVTSTIILKMNNENVLSLSSRLEDCLPQTKRNKLLAPITIKQLLTHSSGLKAWHSFYSHIPGDTVFNILNHIEITHNKGNEVVYSDLNFILLGEVIKHRYHDSLQGVVQKQLVEPLGLKTLTYNPSDQENIAATEFGNRIEKKMCRERNFYFTNWRDEEVPMIGEVNDGNAYYFFGGESGHAGIFSNVKDIVALGELYVKGGVHNGKELISKELIEESLTVQVGKRGLGWEVSDIYPEGFGHTGFTGTALWVEPKRKLTVGLLTNRLNVAAPKNVNPFRKEVFNDILKDI
ncbi:serine hydrolase domain-containing protein [Virgibacillus byunsanensis]|uniref:Serine hydrolase domain-containing protein n=1 Tax=Virgibacillus byunsanensis TaxID=570945 RepID=A0ABW3LQX5_9BACI